MGMAWQACRAACHGTLLLSAACSLQVGIRSHMTFTVHYVLAAHEGIGGSS